MEFEITNDVLLKSAIGILEKANLEKIKKITLKQDGEKFTLELITTEIKENDLNITTGDVMSIAVGG